MPQPAIRRSLSLHAPLRRMPRRVLQELLDHLPPDTPPDGPNGPVAVLERRIAELLGKPSALFFPTGTMAQQVALRVHAEARGRHAFAAHPQTHLAVWEQQGYSVVHGLRFHPLGDRFGIPTLADLAAVREPLAAVLWELPQRDVGGRLPTWDDLGKQVAHVRERGAAVHMDGARLWEAQTYYRRPFAEIADLFDTVYVSLYKALEGVRGAVLAGDDDVIGQAEVWRQRLGGGTRDAWMPAAAGLMGLDRLLPRMPAFRDHAIALSAAIRSAGVADTVPEVPQTPMFHVHLPVSGSSAEAAQAAMIADHGTQLFGRVRSTAHLERCSFEVVVGENALEFDPATVAELIAELVERARSGCFGRRLHDPARISPVVITENVHCRHSARP